MFGNDGFIFKTSSIHEIEVSERWRKTARKHKYKKKHIKRIKEK